MLATSSGNIVKRWKSETLSCLDSSTATSDVQSLVWSGSKLAYVTPEALNFCEGDSAPCNFESLDSKIVCAEFASASDRLIALGLSNGTTVLYDSKRGKIHKKFSSVASQAPVMRVVVLPKETHIVAGHKDGSIVLSSLTTQQTFSPLEKHTNSELVDLQLSPWRRSYLVGLYAAGIVHQWDLNSPGRKMISEIKNLHKGPPTSLTLSPINERTALSAGKDKNVEFLDLKENKLVRTIPTAHPLSAIRFYPDGITVVVGSTRGSLHTFDLRKSSTPLLEVTDAHNGPIANIVFQPVEPKATRAPLSASGANKKKPLRPAFPAPKAPSTVPVDSGKEAKGPETPVSPSDEKENTPVPVSNAQSPATESTPVSMNGAPKQMMLNSSDVKQRLVSDSSVISDSSNVFSPVRNDHSQLMGRGFGGSLGRLSSGSPVFSPLQVASSPITSYTPSRILPFNGSDVVSPSFSQPQQRKQSVVDSSRRIEPIEEEPSSDGFKVSDGPFEACVDLLMAAGKSDVTPQASEVTEDVLSTAFPAAFNTKHLSAVVESAVRKVVDQDLSDTRGNVKDLVSDFGFATMRELIVVQMQLEQMESKYDTVVDQMVALRKEISNLRKFY